MSTTPMTPTEAITAALAAHPEASAAELAEATGIGGSTASKCLASLEREGIVVRHLGGHEGGRRVADRWALAASVVSTSPAPMRRPGGRRRCERVPGSTRRAVHARARLPQSPWRGADRAEQALGKALGRSSGAVANTCQRLESSGSLRLVSASPRRYEIVDA